MDGTPGSPVPRDERNELGDRMIPPLARVCGLPFLRVLTRNVDLANEYTDSPCTILVSDADRRRSTTTMFSHIPGQVSCKCVQVPCPMLIHEPYFPIHKIVENS